MDIALRLLLLQQDAGLFRAVVGAAEQGEQELNTWILRSGCSSSIRTRACSALLWEPLSRADRVTT